MEEIKTEIADRSVLKLIERRIVIVDLVPVTVCRRRRDARIT
jgi:hypothetical protein